MSAMVAAGLNAGVIYGDPALREYVYMPACEIGAETPLCVLETGNRRQDITLDEAVALVRKLSLKPAEHPLLGKTSC